MQAVATSTPISVAVTDSGNAGSPALGNPENCDIGVATEASSPEIEAAQSARVDATIARLARSLRSDADERTRVTGMFIDNTLEVVTPLAAESLASIERCDNAPGCLATAQKSWVDAMRRAPAPSAEAIARLAATSFDPFIYAVALQACNRFGAVPETAPSCNLLSLTQWARLDPQNATPWLQIAAESAARKDAAAVDEAMHRVAAATNNRIYGDQLFRYAMPHVPAGASDVEEADVFMFVLGASGAWQLPTYQTVTQYCAVPLLRDSNRWQACDGIARNFVERGSTMIEKRIGFRIGERLKWPTEKLAVLRDEDEALLHVHGVSSAEADSCHAFERGRDFSLQVARLGEVGALRGLIAASGKSVATLAAEARAERESRAKAIAAEAAASPASAASGA
jgi:hypothetical protein